MVSASSSCHQLLWPHLLKHTYDSAHSTCFWDSLYFPLEAVWPAGDMPVVLVEQEEEIVEAQVLNLSGVQVLKFSGVQVLKPMLELEVRQQLGLFAAQTEVPQGLLEMSLQQVNHSKHQV